jgi:predicted dehydrogenase
VVALLDAGARHVIIEKPIASSADQVDELMAAMGRHPDARVHCAFQRSYSPFNTLLRRDLGDAPTSMAAVVYEVPLPPRHWYRWPVVGNAVVSNGCHWIDYFLHVNGRPEVVELGAVALPDQTVLNIELVTGASASISLRHRGSPRLGVRDTIQFWTEEATATIEDNAWYRSESGYGRRRSSKVHRSRATEEMYKEFGRLIADDLPGDDPAAIGRSARTVVELAALVDRARSARTTGPAG